MQSNRRLLVVVLYKGGKKLHFEMVRRTETLRIGKCSARREHTSHVWLVVFVSRHKYHYIDRSQARASRNKRVAIVQC